MGFGLPAAIGAKIGAPHKMVVDIDGDASFSMTCQELLTAVEYNVPIKVLVLNNHCQGMVRQWQDLFYSERHSMTSMHSASSPAAAAPEARAHRAAAADPCFKGLAEGMGAKGLACSSADDLESTMVGRAGRGPAGSAVALRAPQAEFLAYDDVPIVLDAVCTRDEHVYPMVPAGKTLDEMVMQ